MFAAHDSAAIAFVAIVTVSTDQQSKIAVLLDSVE